MNEFGSLAGAAAEDEAAVAVTAAVLPSAGNDESRCSASFRASSSSTASLSAACPTLRASQIVESPQHARRGQPVPRLGRIDRDRFLDEREDLP
jgi:hypothetical protein